MRKSGYLTKAACRGYRPNRFASYKGRQRSHLIARLARERSIARFIVAPDGYGKTSLAIDYAETMFSWAHVFWINAKSPCFIRDLDDGDIARGCLQIDSGAKLVIIDDLPQLDASRVQRLSREIDVLLSHDCEVVVMCAPSCDLLGSLQLDRLRLGAADLLLTDEEIDAVRPDEERLRQAASSMPAAARVPALAWDSTPGSVAAFVMGTLGEGCPADLLLASCSAFALGKGSIADLKKLGPIDEQFIADALVDYPHLGLDLETGRFEAPCVDAELLARAVKSQITSIVERSTLETREALVWAWADILIDNNEAVGRACDLIRVFCPVKRRAVWLLERARELVRRACFHATLHLVLSLKDDYEMKERVRAVEALCRRMLGDKEGALRCARRCAFEEGVPRDARAIGLIIVARFSQGELRQQASEAITAWAASVPKAEGESPTWFEALVVAWAARAESIDALCTAWKELCDAGVEEDALCVIASWLFTCMGAMPDETARADEEAIAEVERHVRARLADVGDPRDDFFVSSAALSLENAHTSGAPLFVDPLEAPVALALRNAEMIVYAQRDDLKQELKEERARNSVWTSEGRLLQGKYPGSSPVEERAVPTLELKMFGRFSIAIGGMPIDPNRIGRKQARVLLVLLAANAGHDISRDSVAQSMWPNRDIAAARKNFYTAWSQLRRGLALPDGSCPYLVRHQFGCRLNSKFVQSDIARLDDICWELLFGPIDFDAWRDLHKEIRRDFSGELFPIEDRNVLIMKVRENRRSHLVDALVTGSLRLIDAGNPQWAIWYARSALDYEGTREDAFVALMRSQIANDQRTAAMMTYFKCREVLAEELGIDPSPETVALYESLLGD